jgi:hypothetical protein
MSLDGVSSVINLGPTHAEQRGSLLKWGVFADFWHVRISARSITFSTDKRRALAWVAQRAFCGASTS